ncbi:MAG: NfeD family protein [Micromonosporaceae bacterium]|nr:NfeD family protein [Micromonosporaceae bacterium]
MLALIWLIVGVVLAVAEVFTLDFVLIMFGGGAFAAALSGALGAPVPFQIVVFAAVSVLGLVAVRPSIKRRLHRTSEVKPMGVEAIEGTEATVIEEVAEDRGMVKIGGELWSARPYDATQTFAVGEVVRVIQIRGATALVWKE